MSRVLPTLAASKSSLQVLAEALGDGAISSIANSRKRQESRDSPTNGHCIARRVARRSSVRARKDSTRIGDRVTFLITSAFLPYPEEVLASFAVGPVLEGTVVEFSDAGEQPRFFAVVEVIRQERVVVPVEQLNVLQPPALPEP